MDLVGFIRTSVPKWDLGPADIVWANGSRVEGLGNRLSDVDTWVVYADASRPPSVPVHEWRDGVRLNTSAYSRATVESFAAMLNAVDRYDHAAVWSISRNSLDRYYRAATALPVVNVEGAKELQGHFLLVHAVGLFEAWSGLQATAHAQEALALVDGDDPLPALMAARAAVNHALDSHLAANGESYPPFKWTFEKVKRRFGEASDILERGWSLQAPRERTAAEYVREVAAFVEEHVRASFHRPREYAVFAPADAALFTVGTQHYVVHNKTRMYELNEAGKLVWEAIDGSGTSTRSRHGARTHSPSPRTTQRRLSGTSPASSLSMGSSPTWPGTTGDKRMVINDIRAPSISRLPMGAGEFHSAEGRRYYSRSFGNSMLDAEGGIESGQLGMVMVAARAALGFALQAYVHDKWFVGVAPEELLAAFGEATGSDSELYQRARDLLSRAPSSPDLAPEYAEAIKRFVVDDLAIRPPRFSEGNVAGDINDEYWQITQQIDALASYLGMPSPFPIAGRPRFLGGLSDPSTTVRDQA